MNRFITISNLFRNKCFSVDPFRDCFEIFRLVLVWMTAANPKNNGFYLGKSSTELVTVTSGKSFPENKILAFDMNYSGSLIVLKMHVSRLKYF